MAVRPRMSGVSSVTRRSNRPGRSNAGVQDVWTVGRGDDDDGGVGVESVHLDEDLVQCLFALIVTTAEAGATVTTDGVDFVNEDDAWSMSFGLLEEVADARCTDSDEHLDEFGAGNREERHSCFACDGSGEESFSRTGWPH